ncbi:TetR/AcrR family transcriptional regulator [Serinibacter salmoneus]|uniref:TetR family transcriptional regulator n=1 Tax=Serinibacter salmoneus TaxID=556530 RepID=A0A2A9D2J7_9MICO|nr:TetR/AcrR family transcriptional regulator [Serinibacter salmoneus]PFG20883.1 TetR family transcriptional regulator [Serinibacter salmoneus]
MSEQALTPPEPRPLNTNGRPLTKRGEATRAKLLAAAEDVFATAGFHEASIVKITEGAGVGLGTFYLYFETKLALFEALVLDLNRRMRHAMSKAGEGAATRLEAERAGFEAFFAFTAQHPALYRVVREAEFVAPHTLREHYGRILAGYVAGLRRGQADGDVDAGLDPEVTAWALMGAGELIGMRYLLWQRENDQSPALEPLALDPAVLAATMQVVTNALTGRGEEKP